MSARHQIKESGNSRFVGPSVRVSTQREMRAFDKLPPEMRAAFREAIADSTATRWTRHIKAIGAQACADNIRRFDREHAFAFLRQEFGLASALMIAGEPK